MFKKFQRADFNIVPNRDIQRSTIPTKFSHKTTFNAADLIPIMAKEVLPGDIIKGSSAFTIRSSTPIAPVMDELYFETWTFFVANRTLMKGWEKLQGENTDGKWKVGPKGTEGQTPKITPPAGGFDIGCIAEKFAYAVNVDGYTKNHFPIRAYVKIWNEFFRDQNNQVEAFSNYNDNTTVTGKKGADGDPTANAWFGGAFLPVNKFYDYFTYALPAPQKADDVLIPIGTTAPINASPFSSIESDSRGFKVESGDRDGRFSNGIANVDLVVGPTSSDKGFLAAQGESTVNQNITKLNFSTINGLSVDLSSVTATSINDLRRLIAYQQIFENDARHGTRYWERLENLWGIISPLARLDRPEYIGKTKGMLNMQQVLQTSSTDSTTPQGNTAAYSLTSDVNNNNINYAVKEHGWIITVGSVRQTHTYSYGMPKHLSKFERFDFFEPQLAHLGEDFIRNDELYATGTSTDDDAFGYRPKWDEYRHGQSMVSGDFRPQSPKFLGQWTYTDEFNNLPVLGADFIKENVSNIDRTLAVPAATSDQFILDYRVNFVDDRPIPVYGIPGLERI